MDTFRKPTDVNSFLASDSFHPFHLKKNLPFSQLLRLKRNCSCEADFIKQSQITLKQLSEKGYSSRILKHALFKAKQTSRTTLLVPKNKTRNNDKMVVVLTYNKFYNKIKSIINKYWYLLSKVPRCDTTPLFAYKRARNFKDILVHSRLSHKPADNSLHGRDFPKGFFSCKQCKACQNALTV